ncbi:hypothetical protein NP233_g11611 [Leucocoprinus birnbaumii]|uniref:Uncharacterized protein n=1 Tax=Leucocoprinus birnbaumii TaxID=56174 RepID=A0AAD5VIL5_9AGAR|nr:hypothetical protein NP233_g11611 [Leucocoprinus birnbaumii]
MSYKADQPSLGHDRCANRCKAWTIWDSLPLPILETAVQVLLTLRLTALWSQNKIVKVFLYLILFIEIFGQCLSMTSNFYNGSSHTEIDATDPGETVWHRISHVRKFTPVMYTFYRDGTLFTIPILVLVSLVLAAGRTNIFTNPLDYFHWPAFLELAYYLVGTRLILNLRKANCKLTESVVSCPRASVLLFHQSQWQEDETADDSNDSTR